MVKIRFIPPRPNSVLYAFFRPGQSMLNFFVSGGQSTPITLFYALDRHKIWCAAFSCLSLFLYLHLYTPPRDVCLYRRCYSIHNYCFCYLLHLIFTGSLFRSSYHYATAACSYYLLVLSIYFFATAAITTSQNSWLKENKICMSCPPQVSAAWTLPWPLCVSSLRAVRIPTVTSHQWWHVWTTWSCPTTPHRTSWGRGWDWLPKRANYLSTCHSLWFACACCVRTEWFAEKSVVCARWVVVYHICNYF